MILFKKVSACNYRGMILCDPFDSVFESFLKNIHGSGRISLSEKGSFGAKGSLA
jgi:hypothetical protein